MERRVRDEASKVEPKKRRMRKRRRSERETDRGNSPRYSKQYKNPRSSADRADTAFSIEAMSAMRVSESSSAGIQSETREATRRTRVSVTGRVLLLDHLYADQTRSATTYAQIPPIDYSRHRRNNPCSLRGWPSDGRGSTTPSHRPRRLDPPSPQARLGSLPSLVRLPGLSSSSCSVARLSLCLSIGSCRPEERRSTRFVFDEWGCWTERMDL